MSGFVQASISTIVERFSIAETETEEPRLPHVRPAAHLSLCLAEAHAQGALEAFEQMGCGAVLLDGRGTVLGITPKAEEHFRDATLLRIRDKIVAGHRASDPALQRLIAGALRPDLSSAEPPPQAVAIERAAKRPLILRASPIARSAREPFQHAHAVLTMSDPEERCADSQTVLRQAFGLTPAEARLAAGLAGGRDLLAMADEKGVSMATARTQLKSIFTKTGTHRQAELVAFLARLKV